MAGPRSRKTASRAVRVPRGRPDPESAFAALVVAQERRAGVTVSRMFGSRGLRLDGKVFAMFVKGRLVVKLPRERVDSLVAAGHGEHFDPGHGRLIKEWIAIDPTAESGWSALANEARLFVAARR